ncbi:MAG: response regulator [Bryobacteraceae bacterium]|nr:response regulator [Bryobacteraceae bacterium]MCX7604406.1 response regulator [Bryobacteraceae bacterium]
MEERSTRRILVVDDDPGVREVIRSMLESAGYSVLCAENGKEALRILRGTPVDLILTDLVMPEQEGIETIKTLRREYPELKVIAMSGAFGGDYLRIASYLGAHGTLPKPIQMPVLLKLIAETLSGTPQP